MKSFYKEINVMFDLETLAARADAAIISIGAVKFQFEGGPIVDTFKINVDAASCKAHGLYIDKETITWWGKQSKEARQAWMVDPVPIDEALNKFSDWFGPKSLFTWSHGASFDQPILSFAYKKVLNKPEPWKYWHGMCSRTVMNLADYDLKKERESAGNYHDALEDAKAQALAVVKVLGGEPF